MAWVATASSPASFAEVLNGTCKPTIEQQICHLDRLPRELRDMIWCGLVYRPIGVAPKNWYTYHWDSAETFGPREIPWDGDGRDYGQYVTVHWTSKPTEQQTELIASGVKELPVTVDRETGTITEHLIYQRDSTSIEILHSKQLVVKRFRGLSLMRTCKKFNKEVAEVLYGMNRYIFDTRSDTLIASPLQRGDINKFNSTRSQIPGIPDIYGRPRGRKQVMETLERMFDLDDDQDTWLSENPFTAFLRRIGLYNASLLTKIEFEDHFKVGRAGNFDNDPRPLGFAHLLPIYKTILYYACPNLQELTLHVGFCEMWPKQLNPEYPHIKGSSNTTDEEKVYDTLRLLIQGLPWLRKLQLGDYKSMEEPEEDVDWGTSRVWVDRVAARIPGEMDALRPSVFPLSEGPALRTRSTKTHEPRGSRGNRAGRGGRGGTRNAPVDPDGRHQDNTPIISGEDRNSLPRHGTPDRGSRSGEHSERGEPGEVKETMNTSYNAHFNEGRHVVIGTVANERGRHSSSRGRSSRRGNGRGSGTGRDNRGRARRF